MVLSMKGWESSGAGRTVASGETSFRWESLSPQSSMKIGSEWPRTRSELTIATAPRKYSPLETQ